ncbi:MAG: hypothetical protein ACK2U9_02590 [Anaerolineae bacterium]
MQVRKVDWESKQDAARFVKFPFRLYRGCQQWVPPLVSGELLALDQHRHPFYEHSRAAFYVVECQGEVLGRIAVMENREYNRYRRAKTAFFGYFDSVEDRDVADALFDAAAAWAHARGLNCLLGPKGLLAGTGGSVMVDGFERRPPLGVPFNYPYYDRLLRSASFDKDTDYLSADLDTGYALPSRVRDIAQRARQRRGFWVKSFASTKEMRSWAPRVLAAHQGAFARNHTYYPPTPAEAHMTIDTILRVVEPGLAKLLMKGDEIIGFILAFLDISEGLQRARGRLWPVGWWHILREQWRTRQLNLNGFGLLPGHRGLGADAVLFVALDETVRSSRFESAYLVQAEEGNVAIMNQAAHLGVEWVQRHRSYQRLV